MNDSYSPDCVDLADVAAGLARVKALKGDEKELNGKLAKIEVSKASVSPAVYEKVRGEYKTKLGAIDKDFGQVKKALLTAFLSLQREYISLQALMAGCESEMEELKLRNSLGEFTDEEVHTHTDEVENRRASAMDRQEQVAGTLTQIYQNLADEPEFLPIGSPLPYVEAAPPPPEPVSEPVPPAAPEPVEDIWPAPVGPLGAEHLEEPPIRPPAPSAPVHEVRMPPDATTPEIPFGQDVYAAALGGSGIPDLDEEILREAEKPGDADDLGDQPLGGDSSVPREFFDEMVEPGHTPPAEASHPRETSTETAAGSPEFFIPTLIIKDKENREHSYQLQIGPTMIGRAPENDIVLLEENVSRRHAKVVRETDRIYILDLKSSNGSWVNGAKLLPHQPVELHDNDVLKIGKTLVLFKCAPDD